MKTRTSSPAHQKAVVDVAKEKYGTHKKEDGLARCAGKCKRLLPFDAFDMRRNGKTRQNWCRECRAVWMEAGLGVTYTANPVRNGS